MKYDDAKNYTFHEKDIAGKCFLCARNGDEFFVVRQISSMKMVHLCRDCMLKNLSEYLLDNTVAWLKNKKDS